MVFAGFIMPDSLTMGCLCCLQLGSYLEGLGSELPDACVQQIEQTVLSRNCFALRSTEMVTLSAQYLLVLAKLGTEFQLEEFSHTL